MLIIILLGRQRKGNKIFYQSGVVTNTMPFVFGGDEDLWSFLIGVIVGTIIGVFITALISAMPDYEEHEDDDDDKD